jgi:CzcA family heavy metal efflux pump
MLTWLVSTSLRLRIVVVALSVVLIVVGIRTVRKAPLDVFPEFAPPIVEIQTEAPGLSTDEVESLVTVPLENALNGVIGLKTLRSKSVLGLSSVVLVLQEGADLMKTRQLVQERLAVEAPRLPAVAKTPVILQPLSTTSRAMKIGVWSDKLNQRDLTILALWTIRPKLMSLPGVANVAIWGQRDTQFQVLVDPDRLMANGVTLDKVLKAAADATSLDTGGFLDSPNGRTAVRHLSPITTPEDLKRTVVDIRGGAPIRIGDVAEVEIGSPPPIGDAIINDGPGLLLIVEKQPTGNTLDVTHAVDKALAELKPGLKDVEIDATIFRPATFIERAIDNLTHALVIGCALVMVILVVFLFDWRTALISLTAIPLSLVAAALVLYWWGTTINTMVLAGLVIALGEVVDDAIIDVENIVRRLRLNRMLERPRSAFLVVLEASLEVRSAVVYASFIVTMVFLPVFFLDGLAGSFFRPLAVAYVLAILASLLVALTVTPALSYIMLTGKRGAREEAPLTSVLKRLYRKVLPPLVAHPMYSIAILAGLFAATVVAGLRLGHEFLPEFQETDFLMHFVEKPGTSLDAMRRITIQASKELRAIPGVKNFGSHLGRAEVADEVYGPHFTELWISLDPDKCDYKETVKKINDTIEGYPGLRRDVLTYLKERIKEVLTGASATIVVRLYGPDLEKLREKAAEVEARMKTVNGAINIKVEPIIPIPQLEVRLKPEAAERHGLTAGQVRRLTSTFIKGTKVGELYEDQKKYDAVVWGVPSVRTDIEAVRNLRIETPSGSVVPLGEVAYVAIVPTPNEIKHENASRRLDVTCNVKDRPLGEVAQEIEAKVLDADKGVKFDREYHPEFLGEYAAQQESSRRLFWLSVLAFMGIVLLLHVDFQSWRLTMLVVLTIPFALVGGVFAALLGGGVLSLGSLVGFVTVLGIAARNGIMLVSHYRHLEEVEGEKFGPELVLRGAEERLAPILMTALATGLALLPLVVGGLRPGQEIEYPLAIVILGGLTTSTILNLFLLPPLYGLFGKARTPDETGENALDHRGPESLAAHPGFGGEGDKHGGVTNA